MTLRIRPAVMMRMLDEHPEEFAFIAAALQIAAEDMKKG